MIHELLGIRRNTVDMREAMGENTSQQEIVLSSDDDSFYNSVMFRNFGEVAEEIHNLV
jgi:hypothetical protein